MAFCYYCKSLFSLLHVMRKDSIRPRLKFRALVQIAHAAPGFGPVIGRSLIQTVGWRWIFWFLVIITGVHFILIFLFLPETQRRIVGNGGFKTRGVYILELLHHYSKSKHNREQYGEPLWNAEEISPLPQPRWHACQYYGTALRCLQYSLPRSTMR